MYSFLFRLFNEIMLLIPSMALGGKLPLVTPSGQGPAN